MRMLEMSGRLLAGAALAAMTVAAVPADAATHGGYGGGHAGYGGHAAYGGRGGYGYGGHGGYGYGGHGWWGGRGWWGGVGYGIGWGYPYYGYGYYPAYYGYAGYPAPAYPAQAAPAPQAAPAAARSFNVFFDFDRADITAASAAVIRDAATAARASGVTQIHVTGHTDSAGKQGYDQALSERRAAAVRRELVADGVQAASIVATGVGKTGQMVPTGDQVREVQNRRVEIVLGDGAVADSSAPSSGTRVATSSCRDFQRTIVIDGHSMPASGTACEQGDGSWRIVR